MRALVFSARTAKEILRDPLSIAFGLGFPLVVLALLSIIQKNVPVSLFEIDSLTPGITVFGLSFITLFSALIIAKDRSGAFLTRLYTTPLKSGEYIAGYMLPVIPIAVLQCIVCYIAAFAFGLKPCGNIILACLFIIPCALFFIAFGLLCGSIFNDKQVGGICGAILTNLSAWLSGIWFDLSLVGGWFENIANVLPFVHAVKLEQAVLNGDLYGIFPHIFWVMGYAVSILILAVTAFLRQMKKG